MKVKIIFYKTFTLIYLLLSTNVSATDGEISFGIAMGKGIMENYMKVKVFIIMKLKLVRF